MKETYQILLVYAGDVSGVCSALYELGGMTVMHDPSGCNSTYNTFDETRWYDKESLIFLSGLTDVDAVMGNDDRLIRDVEETARALKPRFVALANSPIPYLNGTDFGGICRLLERDLNLPAFHVPTNGAHDYTEGAGQTFLRVAEKLVEDPGRTVPGAVNILGMTPLDFAGAGSAAHLKKRLEDHGFSVISNWSLDTCLEDIQRAGQAQVNLVVSSAGLYAAKRLRERFGTPFVTGIPVDGFADEVYAALKNAVETGENQSPYLAARRETPAEYTLVGEPVVTGSLAAALERKHGCGTKVICPTEITEGLLCPWDRAVQGEEAIIEALASAKRILADPLYRAVSPTGAEFLEVPHLALSGRLYRRRYPDYFAGFWD